MHALVFEPIMMRFVVALLLSSSAALAQFTALATDRSGDRVFFFTSFRQTGTDQIPDAKLFVREADGALKLLYAPPDTGDPFTGGMTILQSISVSSDGRIAGVSGRTSCVGGSSCFFRNLEWAFATDVGNGLRLAAGTTALISRNGRFMGSKSPSGGPPGQWIESKIADLATGEVRNRGFGIVLAVSGGGDAVTSNGLVRWNGESERFPFQAASVQADESFTRFAGERLTTRQVFAFDRTTGREWPLSPDDRPSYSPRISDDGRHVLYITEIGGVAQLMLVGWDGSYWRQLTTGDEAVLSGALSGDGRVVWASTRDGRLLRIDSETASAREVFAPPFLELPVAATAGSLVRIRGVRLSRDIRVEGLPLHVISATDSEVLAQVPWEAKAPDPPRHRSLNYGLLTARREDSALEWVSPRFNLTLNNRMDPWSAPIHEDWSSFVSAERPAARGEVLHFYATGLGATECHLETGQPSPVDRVCSALQGPWIRWCAYNEACPQAELRFAGLAPGMLGLYQIDVAVPPDAAGPTAVLMGISNAWMLEIPLRP